MYQAFRYLQLHQWILKTKTLDHYRPLFIQSEANLKNQLKLDGNNPTYTTIHQMLRALLNFRSLYYLTFIKMN